MLTWTPKMKGTLCQSGGLAIVLGATLVGCGPSFDGRVYASDTLSFRVPRTPPGWRQVDADGVLLAFRDDAAEASVAVNGRCGKDGDDVPLQALTHHLFINFTDRKVIEQRRFQLDGREALKTEITAKLDGVPKHFIVVVLKKNGCVYDFFYVQDVESAADREEFLAYVRGFATLRP